MKEPVDIFISHDWPQGIEQMGNVEDLLRTKPGLRHDVERKRLGNPYTRDRSSAEAEATLLVRSSYACEVRRNGEA